MEYKFGQLSELEVVDEQKRIVKGFFGTDKVDAEGHFIPVEVYAPAIMEWLKWGNIRDAHGAAVGNVTGYDMGKGWNYIEAVIVDDSVWNKIVGGVYKGFSIGAKVFEKTYVPFASIAEDMFDEIPGIVRGALEKIGKLLRIDSMMIVEVSVTDRPVNQGAVFVKSMDADIPVLQSVLMEQTLEFSSDLAKVEEKQMSENENENVTEADTTQETVNTSDSVEETVLETFDAQKAYGDVTSRLDTIEQSITTITQEFTAKLEEVTKSQTSEDLQSLMADVQKALAAIEELRAALQESDNESESEKTTEEVVEVTDSESANKNASLTIEDVESIIAKTVTKTIETIVGDTAVTRKNLVNSGEGDVEEDEQKQEAAPAPLHVQYKNLATMIGRTLQR